MGDSAVHELSLDRPGRKKSWNLWPGRETAGETDDPSRQRRTARVHGRKQSFDAPRNGELRYPGRLIKAGAVPEQRN